MTPIDFPSSGPFPRLDAYSGFVPGRRAPLPDTGEGEDSGATTQGQETAPVRPPTGEDVEELLEHVRRLRLQGSQHLARRVERVARWVEPRLAPDARGHYHVPLPPDLDELVRAEAQRLSATVPELLRMVAEERFQRDRPRAGG